MSWDGGWGPSPESYSDRSPRATDLQLTLLKNASFYIDMKHIYVLETDTKMPPTFVHSIEKNYTPSVSPTALYCSKVL